MVPIVPFFVCRADVFKMMPHDEWFFGNQHPPLGGCLRNKNEGGKRRPQISRIAQIKGEEAAQESFTGITK
jgi:hypothetical protein